MITIVASHTSHYLEDLIHSMVVADGPESKINAIYLDDFTMRPFSDSSFGAILDLDLRADRYNRFFARKNSGITEIKQFNPFVSYSFLRQSLKSEFPLLITGWNNINLWMLLGLATVLKKRFYIRNEATVESERASFHLVKAVKRLFLRYVISRSDKVFFIGQRNKRFYKSLSISDDKLEPFFYGVKNSRFSCRREITASSVINLCFVGKLISRKDPLLLLRAVIHLPPKIRDRIRLTFIGDGNLRVLLAVLAKRSGLCEQVQFSGLVNPSELPAFLADQDVLILPSVQDTWGLVVNEAMAAGNFIIVSDGCGCSEDLVDENTGAVFRTGDIVSLIDAIVRVSKLVESNIDRQAVLRKVTQYDVLITGRCVVEQMRESS